MKKTSSSRRGKPQAAASSVHAVILAGGAGERFWPASRRERPKPLMRVVGGESLLATTVGRAQAFAPEGNVWIVCGSEHAKAIRDESGLPHTRVLVEPARRNTAMAVAWGAQRIQAEDSEAVVAILSADHHIPDRRAFAAAMRRCARVAAREDVLLTLGIKPTHPDTGYGYIQQGAPAGGNASSFFRVRRFVEKPDATRARRYLSSGSYFWNAGVFVFSVRTMWGEIRETAPDLNRALAPLRRQPKGRNSRAVKAAYQKAPSLPIDVCGV